MKKENLKKKRMMKKVSNSNIQQFLQTEQELLQNPNFLDYTTYDNIALWWHNRYRIYDSFRAHDAVSPLMMLLSKGNIFTETIDFIYSLSTLILCRFFTRGLDKNKKKALISYQYAQFRQFRDIHGNIKNGDIYFDEITKQLTQRNFEVFSSCPLGYSLSDFKSFLRVYKQLSKHRAFNNYWNFKVWLQTRNAKKHFKQQWIKLNQDKELVSYLKQNNLYDKLYLYFMYAFSRTIKNIETAKNMIKQEHLNTILMINEYGAFNQSLITATKHSKTKTVALQHGLLDLGNIFPKNAIFHNSDMKTVFSVISDKTCVFGKYYYDIFTKQSTYPELNVVITGNPRYDTFFNAKETYKKQRICRKLGINEKKNIVLILTGNVSTGEQYLRKCLQTLKQFDVEIIISPHPCERTEWYKQVVNEENAKVVILNKDDEFRRMESLSICDVVITGMCTTSITDVMIMNKPVITFYSTFNADLASYYQHYVFSAFTEQELSQKLKQIFNNRNIDFELSILYKDFLEEHMYKIDGKSSERIVNVVEKLINDRKS